MLGAGDQGMIVFGYACRRDQTELMPLPTSPSRTVSARWWRLSDTSGRWRGSCIPYLRPDGKSQVRRSRYVDGKLRRGSTPC